MGEIRTAADLLGGWKGGRLSGEPPKKFPTTTFPTIDQRPGRLVLLGGPPAAGKTTAAVQLVTEALALSPDLRAVIGNVEMPAEALLDKIVARLAAVPIAALDDRALTADQRRRVESALARYADLWPRLGFVTPPFTLTHLVKAGFGAGVLVADYLQRFGDAKARDQRQELDGIMSSVRRVCDAGAAFVCVAAVGRQRNAKGAATYAGLNLASFRGSSELEFGCDAAYLLTPDAGDGRRVVMACAKNRYGEPKDLLLRFDRAVQSFGKLDVLDAFDDAGGGAAA